jgi:hypothetical protein
VVRIRAARKQFFGAMGSTLIPALNHYEADGGFTGRGPAIFVGPKICGLLAGVMRSRDKNPSCQESSASRCQFVGKRLTVNSFTGVVNTPQSTPIWVDVKEWR